MKREIRVGNQKIMCCKVYYVENCKAFITHGFNNNNIYVKIILQPYIVEVLAKLW